MLFVVVYMMVTGQNTETLLEILNKLFMIYLVFYKM